MRCFDVRVGHLDPAGRGEDDLLGVARDLGGGRLQELDGVRRLRCSGRRTSSSRPCRPTACRPSEPIRTMAQMTRTSRRWLTHHPARVRIGENSPQGWTRRGVPCANAIRPTHPGRTARTVRVGSGAVRGGAGWARAGWVAGRGLGRGGVVRAGRGSPVRLLAGGSLVAFSDGRDDAASVLPGATRRTRPRRSTARAPASHARKRWSSRRPRAGWPA